MRALFMLTVFVGLGLLALKYPSAWMHMIVKVAVLLLVVYAFISALVSTGNRRLFWAAFAATAVAFMLMSENFLAQFLPYEWTNSIFLRLHPADEMGVQNREANVAFAIMLNRLCLILISTIAAYLIPWLVQRRCESTHD